MRFVIQCLLLLFFVSNLSAFTFEERKELHTGIDYTFGVPLGEVSRQYGYSHGVNIFLRGMYHFNIYDRYYLFPDVRFGWNRIGHESEAGRHMDVFPFQINAMGDMPILRFDFESALLKIYPYCGYGLYYVKYTSPRSGDTSFDNGYQVGLYLGTDVKKIHRITFDLNFEHFMILEKDALYTGFNFNIGISHLFSFKEKKKIEAGRIRNTRPEKKGEEEEKKKEERGSD